MRGLFLLAGVLLQILPTQSIAEETAPSAAFDTPGYLDACSSRIPDVALQTPMLRVCVSTASKLCNMSLELQGLRSCVMSITSWLERENSRIEDRYPQILAENEANPEISGLMLLQETKLDCTDTQTTGLSSSEFCAYQTALYKWFKLRVVELDQSNRTR